MVMRLAAAVSVTTVSTASDSIAPNNFRRLNKDTLEEIMGLWRTDNPDIFEVGFSNRKDLANLALISKSLAANAQITLQKLKAFILSRVTPVVMRPALTEADTRMVKLLLDNDPTGDYQGINFVAYCSAANILKSFKMNHEAVDLLVLGAALPNTSFNTLTNEMKKAINWGYPDLAFAMYELILTGAYTAASSDIRKAAQNIAALGDPHKTAVRMYELSARHPHATPSDIRAAAGKIAEFGDKATAVSVYVQSAKHAKATLSDMRDAAGAIAELGEKAIVAEVYELILDEKYGATSEAFVTIANDMSERLGSEYEEKINAFQARAKKLEIEERTAH
jgi:hypothetical protein